MSQGIRMPAAFLALRKKAPSSLASEPGDLIRPHAGGDIARADPASPKLDGAEDVSETSVASTVNVSAAAANSETTPDSASEPYGEAAQLNDPVVSSLSGAAEQWQLCDTPEEEALNEPNQEPDEEPDVTVSTIGLSDAAVARTMASGPNGINANVPAGVLAPPSQTSLAMTTASLPLAPSEIDRYGFKKYSQYITRKDYDEWAAGYEVYRARRKEKWVKLLQEHGLSADEPIRFPPSSSKLKRYIRKGIPSEWRGNAWFWFARGHDKLNAHPGLYAKLVEDSVDLKNNDTEHIERDLHRTFPDNAHFRPNPETGAESEKVQLMRRVLTAFSVYQPKIGYCQSLNFLVGTLLLFMDEERAFWMLVLITQNYLVGLHEVNLEQVNISQGILMVNIRDRMPKVWESFGLEAPYQDNFVSNLPPISLCTASWFMSMFVCILPVETMLRVWDAFFFEGTPVIYRIALTMFKLVEPQLLAANDDMEVFQKIQRFPHTLIDPTILLGTCFKRTNGFGHVSQSDINSIHQFVANRRKDTKDTKEPSSTTDREEYTKFRPRQRLKSRLHLYN